MLENWVNDKVKNYLENNIETILGNMSDKTICNFFIMSKDFIIEARHLKQEILALKTKKEKLKLELIKR
jgi:hypothetical protein